MRLQARPWTGYQSVTELIHGDRQLFTPTVNLQSPVNLTNVSLDCGRKLEQSKESQASTEATCRLHTENLNAINGSLWELTHFLRQCHMSRDCSVLAPSHWPYFPALKVSACVTVQWNFKGLHKKMSETSVTLEDRITG